jgi:4-amino-4-deoxy-L-arabinose transferase-like glycosyltransferase
MIPIMRAPLAAIKKLFFAQATPASRHVALLLLLCALLYLPYLGNTPFFDKGEPREALAVQDIVQRGEWLFPLKRATAIPSKPPLFHWSAALAEQITGTLDEATIRFPSALYATLGTLLIYLLGRRLFGAPVGLLGGAILATTLIYQNQALSARVDMTLCFFVTSGLLLFYTLYRGILTHRLWYFALYALVGLGTLAKGPLGLLLPALVMAVFLTAKKRWDLIAKFAFHPGVALTLIIVVGWYGLAITRGGEGFVNRQLLSENLNRFFGGSGHSHPVYYYLPYLFSLGLPWSLFLPFVLWDSFRRGSGQSDDRLFLKVWLAVMFLFFSLSAGKRAVYLLPLYPALALLTALWIHDHVELAGARRWLFRGSAIFAGIVGTTLLAIAVGALLSQEPGWFFSPIAKMLKPKDRVNLSLVHSALNSLGALFTVVLLVTTALWLGLARWFWLGRLRLAAWIIVLNALPFMFISRGVLLPVIAADKSYRDFMDEVNRRVTPSDKLSLYGEFNGESLLFYRGGFIDVDERPAAQAAPKLVAGKGFVIMTEPSWNALQKLDANLPAPLLHSRGKGPEGDAPLVLLQAEIS